MKRLTWLICSVMKQKGGSVSVMWCNGASGRDLTGEMHARDEHNNVTNYRWEEIVQANFADDEDVSEVWQKCDNALTKFKRRWMMYCQENQWRANVKVEEGCACWYAMYERRKSDSSKCGSSGISDLRNNSTWWCRGERGKLECGHLWRERAQRFQLQKIEGGPNFVSWREAKTTKLGRYCMGTTGYCSQPLQVSFWIIHQKNQACFRALPLISGQIVLYVLCFTTKGIRKTS